MLICAVCFCADCQKPSEELDGDAERSDIVVPPSSNAVVEPSGCSQKPQEKCAQEEKSQTPQQQSQTIQPGKSQIQEKYQASQEDKSQTLRGQTAQEVACRMPQQKSETLPETSRTPVSRRSVRLSQAARGSESSQQESQSAAGSEMSQRESQAARGSEMSQWESQSAGEKTDGAPARRPIRRSSRLTADIVHHNQPDSKGEKRSKTYCRLRLFGFSVPLICNYLSCNIDVYQWGFVCAFEGKNLYRG